MYLIWCYERKKWWKQTKIGYTGSILEAGRFTKTEAKTILERANLIRLEETMVPELKAAEFQFENAL